MKTKPICKIDADGTKFWCLNGELHREDGPACEYASGGKFWYLNDKELTEGEFNKAMNTPQTNDGGPAFPIPYGQVMSEEGKGMTLRVWLAGKAMAGLLSSWSSPGCEFFEADNVAKFAYEYADAMIAAMEESK